ncbi:MAG: ABC transporter substrate-binding protein [Myxococcaceae bacterium]|nr:ABC transporter substrate-binding protein [Myxococcaceae bacterium]
MARTRQLLSVMLAGTVGGAACSLINGSGFEECTTDLQCGASRVCVQRYCIPMPAQCRREVGAFDAVNPIRIAALLPLSEGLDGGIVDASEVAGLNAMGLAIEDGNAGGGVNPRLFALYVCNTGRLKDVLSSQVDWAVRQLDAPAILTSGSSQTAAAADTLRALDAGTLIVSATSTSEELIGIYQRTGAVFRVAPPDTLQVPVMARTLASEPDYSAATTLAVLYEDSNYALGIASALRNQLVSMGKTADIKRYTKPVNAQAVISSLTEVHGATVRPKVTIFVGFPSELLPILQATRATQAFSYLGGNRWFFSDSSKDTSIITPETLSQLVGAIGTTPAQGAGIVYADFRSRYRDRFRIDPNDFSFTSHSYDAAYLVMLSAAYALRDNGQATGPRMREALTKVSSASGTTFRLSPMAWRDASAALMAGRSINVEGTSGSLDFDLDAGAPPSPYEVWQVTDGGTFTTLRLVNP